MTDRPIYLEKIFNDRKIFYIDLEMIWNPDLLEDPLMTKLLINMDREYQNIHILKSYIENHVNMEDCMHCEEDNFSSFFSSTSTQKNSEGEINFKFTKQDLSWPHSCDTNSLFLWVYLTLLNPEKNFYIMYFPDHFVCVEVEEDIYIYDMDIFILKRMGKLTDKYGTNLIKNLQQKKEIIICADEIRSCIERDDIDLYNLSEIKKIISPE